MHQQQEEEEEEPRQREDRAVAVHLEHEDADLIPNEHLLRLVNETSPCAAVRKQQDIMDTAEYNNLMRMTNAEQYEPLREIIHRWSARLRCVSS